MNDIEIANSIKKKDIKEVAVNLGVDSLIQVYGDDKAKINFEGVVNDRHGKLILVTSINPTPYGEGKTTVSIGLLDGLCKLGKKAVAALREPSLGPVFGIKGGATGGGYSQVVPMEDINLHFTGDFHAITAANNLIAAAIDNHIYFGNELEIDVERICFRRCLDVNDRALRLVDVGSRIDKFNITAASEVMSILCLASDMIDLKKRLANILVAYSIKGRAIYVRDLQLEGSLLVILKDAIKPNLVQTLEGNPVIIHGGPFANIAHGCNSIIATNLGLKLADYVVTEAGFGSDLGAEKFFDIKCRKAGLKPDCVVIVVTIKALKYNAYVDDEKIVNENVEAVRQGCSNLGAHIANMKLYTNNVVVTLNKYNTDTLEEIKEVEAFVKAQGVSFVVNDSYKLGGSGAIDFALTVVNNCNNKNDFKLLYDDNVSIKEKIIKVCTSIYHATGVNFSEEALQKIKMIEDMGYSNYPVCIAKTQYSFSDDAKLRGNPTGYDVNVRNVEVYAGAQFIVVYLGNIMTMPGLSKKPNYENIDMLDGQIKGLF